MLNFKALIGGVYRDIKTDQSVILGIPEIRQILKAKETKMAQSRLYFLQNKGHFDDLMNINEKERAEKIKELKKEIDEITIIEKESYKKAPLYLIKQEKEQDKGSWKHYQYLMRV